MCSYPAFSLDGATEVIKGAGITGTSLGAFQFGWNMKKSIDTL